QLRLASYNADYPRHGHRRSQARGLVAGDAPRNSFRAVPGRDSGRDWLQPDRRLVDVLACVWRALAAGGADSRLFARRRGALGNALRLNATIPVEGREG